MAEMCESHAASTQEVIVLRDYVKRLSAALGEDLLYIERKFISDDKWRKYSGSETFRYSGVLREQEPDLKKLLVNRRLVIVGEPGSGKSTITRAVVRMSLTTARSTAITRSKGVRGRNRLPRSIVSTRSRRLNCFIAHVRIEGRDKNFFLLRDDIVLAEKQGRCAPLRRSSLTGLSHWSTGQDLEFLKKLRK